MNKYPLWKNILLIALFLLCVIYAAPNVFGEYPSVQITSTTPGLVLTESILDKVKATLHSNNLKYDAASIQNKMILVKFSHADAQLQAKTFLKKDLGDQYIVAINLESATPAWLTSLGARPMKLGLDLRGGVHFLLQVDVDSVLKRHEAGDVKNIGEQLRNSKIRYTGIASQIGGKVSVRFQNAKDIKNALNLLEEQFSGFSWKDKSAGEVFQLDGIMMPEAMQKVTQYVLDQTMTTLHNRVNELGVSEAVVQQEGIDRISVDLPGIQDAAQAKDILGKTATLEFHLVDSDHDSADAVGGLIPAGDELYTHQGYPVLLKSRIVLTGDSITNATSSFDESGRPSVSIRLGGGGESLFQRITGENVGKQLAVVYAEKKPTQRVVDGQTKITYKDEKKVINVATIQSELGDSFQITGLSSHEESQNLALLLRAGSLPAALAIIEEQTIGPSMGEQNIKMGMLSVEIGLALVVIFMGFYYNFFGLVSDVGLLINIVFLVAILSLLGATLTFPGIAGFVLTVGMAVDANVLIYERIREELRNGAGSQAAIRSGYDRAFVTIVDANVTTLIVAMILFALGTGAIKGFAIILTIGLLTSMLAAVTYTRGIVNWMYGSKRGQELSIGIKIQDRQCYSENKRNER